MTNFQLCVFIGSSLPCSGNHPERPERVSSIWSALETAGYVGQCTRVEVCTCVAISNSDCMMSLQSREATTEELMMVHR